MDRKIWLPIFLIISSCVLFFIIFNDCRPDSISDLKSEFVSIDSCRVHYKVSGNGPATVVFVHGFGCDMNTWEAQYEEFRNYRNIRLVFIDLPGYGLSGKPHVEYTLQYFADAVTAVLDKIGAGDVVLVGHSLGTPVCRQVLISGNRRGGFFDIDGVYCFYSEPVAPEYEAAIQAFASSFDGPGCRSVIEGFVQSLAGPDTPEDVSEYAMGVMPETPEYVASSTMHNLIDKCWWDGSQITVPTTVICTQNSGLDPDNREKMAELYPNLDYTELTTCGHFIQMEQSETVNDKIRSLVGKVFLRN
ncbi:MAG: alpha/beta fold hydrolase [Candidatus Cryptobacteroides sp.]